MNNDVNVALLFPGFFFDVLCARRVERRRVIRVGYKVAFRGLPGLRIALRIRHSPAIRWELDMQFKFHIIISNKFPKNHIDAIEEHAIASIV